MGFQIDFLGLVYFHREKNHRLVLLPDGTNPEPGIAPHFASFFIEKIKVNGTPDWWPGRDLKEICVHEFPIPEAVTLTISGLEAPSGAGGCWPFTSSSIESHRENLLSHLKDADPHIHIVPSKAETIARLDIWQGRIETFLMKDAAVTRLTIPNYNDMIEIKATTTKGVTKTLRLRNETEIVLSNTSRLLPPRTEEERLRYPKSHFRIYAKLAVDEDPDRLTLPATPKLPPFPSSHPYIVLLEQHEVPGADCGNTCCG
jgi:hypothetical protein